MKNKHAQALAKKSWEKRKLTQDSEYFRKLAKKRWKNTPRKKKTVKRVINSL